MNSSLSHNVHVLLTFLLICNCDCFLFQFLNSNEGNILGISTNQGDTGSDGNNNGHFDSQGNTINTNFGHGFGSNSLLNPPFAMNRICEPYKGSVCSQYIKNATISVTSRTEQSYLESQLNNVLKHVATWRDISPQCHRFAMPLLCFTAFSLCTDEYLVESTPRKVRQNCLVCLIYNMCKFLQNFLFTFTSSSASLSNLFSLFFHLNQK